MNFRCFTLAAILLAWSVALPAGLARAQSTDGSLPGEILRNGGTLTSVEVEHEVGKSGRRTLLLNTRTLARGGGRPDLILLAIEDIAA